MIHDNVLCISSSRSYVACDKCRFSSQVPQDATFSMFHRGLMVSASDSARAHRAEQNGPPFMFPCVLYAFPDLNERSHNFNVCADRHQIPRIRTPTAAVRIVYTILLKQVEKQRGTLWCFYAAVGCMKTGEQYRFCRATAHSPVRRRPVIRTRE